eukprot:403338537
MEPLFGQPQRLVDNMDVCQQVIAFLSRKQKFILQQINKDFRNSVVPRSMITLTFIGNQCVTESTLFSQCVSTCRKVETLKFEEAKVNLAYCGVLEKALSNPATHKFLSRVKTLTIKNITFEGDNELQTNLAVGKFCQSFIKFTNLDTLEIIGTTAIKRPQIEEVNLELNGIEPEYCLYFQMLLNFETLQHLNISHNWIGLHGLELIKDQFPLFKNLRILKIGGNKLFLNSDHRTENLRDMLYTLRHNLEELHIHENAMENEDFEILIPTLISFQKLKTLNLNVNRVNGQFMRMFLNEYIENSHVNNLSLEVLHLSQNNLRDDGVSDLFDRIHKMPKLRHVNINANKCTEFILNNFVSFIKDLEGQRELVIDFKKQDIRPKERINFKETLYGAIAEKDPQTGDYKRKRLLVVNM